MFRATIILLCLFEATLLLRAQPALTVCEALDRLDELNGKAVRIRGVWFSGDTGDLLWASPPCQKPVVRDGWLWHHTIAVSPPRFLGFMKLLTKLRDFSVEHANDEIMVTLTGVISTRDHFSRKAYVAEPQGYGRYFVAQMIFSNADDIDAIPLSAEERRRWDEEAMSPQPGPSGGGSGGSGGSGGEPGPASTPPAKHGKCSVPIMQPTYTCCRSHE